MATSRSQAARLPDNGLHEDSAAGAPIPENGLADS